MIPLIYGTHTCQASTQWLFLLPNRISFWLGAVSHADQFFLQSVLCASAWLKASDSKTQWIKPWTRDHAMHGIAFEPCQGGLVLMLNNFGLITYASGWLDLGHDWVALSGPSYGHRIDEAAYLWRSLIRVSGGGCCRAALRVGHRYTHPGFGAASKKMMRLRHDGDWSSTSSHLYGCTIPSA